MEAEDTSPLLLLLFNDVESRSGVRPLTPSFFCAEEFAIKQVRPQRQSADSALQTRPGISQAKQPAVVRDFFAPSYYANEDAAADY